MITTQEVHELFSRGAGAVLDPDGVKLGRVGQVYLDHCTGEPEWVTVGTGLFRAHESLVPLGDARVTGRDITVAYGKAKVRDAPRVGSGIDARLSREQEAELYEYYGLDDPESKP